MGGGKPEASVGLVHKYIGVGEVLRQRGGQIIPARLDLLRALLGGHAAQGGRDDALMGQLLLFENASPTLQPVGWREHCSKLRANWT